MGEIVQSSAEEARRRADRIKVGVEAVWQLIVEAYQKRDWVALGYASWDDYTTREFGTSRIKLPREERQEVVQSLRDAGLSTRAIAAATGVDRKTVRRDLEVGEMGPPARPVVCEGCGALIDRCRCLGVESTVDEDGAYRESTVVDDPDPAETQSADPGPSAGSERPTVTGVDGKSYPKEQPVRTDPRIVRQQERRKQVRRLHDQGYTTQEIADRLGCSVSVVQKDVSALGIGRGTGARTASPEHVTESIVNQMRAVSMACSGVDFDLIDVPPAVAAAWRADLEEGRKAITRIIRALQRKEQP